MIDFLVIASLATLMVGLASIGFTLVFVTEYGPYRIFERIPEWFNEYPDQPDTDETDLKRLATLRGNIFLVLTCQFCLSFWVCLLFSTIMAICITIVNVMNGNFSTTFLMSLIFAWVIVTGASYGFNVLTFKRLNKRG